MDHQRQHLSLTGEQRQALLTALQHAFPRPNDLERMLSFHLNIPLATIAPQDGTYTDILFAVIQYFHASDRISDLLHAARQANPTSQALQSIEQHLLHHLPLSIETLSSPSLQPLQLSPRSSEATSHPPQTSALTSSISSPPWWVVLCQWLWKLWIALATLVGLPLVINLLSSWLTVPKGLFPPDAPITWILDQWALLLLVFIFLLLLAVITTLLARWPTPPPSTRSESPSPALQQQAPHDAAAQQIIHSNQGGISQFGNASMTHHHHQHKES